MRIAMIVPEFPRESFLVAKFLDLLDRGVDAHVVCYQSDRRAWRRFSELAGRRDALARTHVADPARRPFSAAGQLVGATVSEGARRPRETFRFMATERPDRSAARRLVRLARDAVVLRLRPDVVHVEFGFLAPEAIHLVPALDRPLIVSLRGADICYVGVEIPGFYDDVWRSASAIHCLGDDLWRRALARGCPPDKPHALIPPAVDAGFFSPSNEQALGSNRLVLLSVARLHWKKGLEYALQAVRRLLDQGFAVEYRIVGKGGHRRVLRACIHDLGLRDHVSLLGELGREALREELRDADVFVHPAVSEGFGNAVLEAQAVGLPVVASDAEGLSEAVADGVSGYVVPRWDPPALADRVAELAADPQLRRRMGRAGRERMLSDFRRDRQTDAFVELYERVAGGTPSSPVTGDSNPHAVTGRGRPLD